MGRCWNHSCMWLLSQYWMRTPTCVGKHEATQRHFSSSSMKVWMLASGQHRMRYLATRSGSLSLLPFCTNQDCLNNHKCLRRCIINLSVHATHTLFHWYKNCWRSTFDQTMSRIGQSSNSNWTLHGRHQQSGTGSWNCWWRLALLSGCFCCTLHYSSRVRVSRRFLISRTVSDRPNYDRIVRIWGKKRIYKAFWLERLAPFN